jgi:hypothetical protein
MASDHPLRRRRSPRPYRVTAAMAASLVIALGGAPALAQSLSDRETARGLMEDGDDKRESGDLKGALKSYQAADAIMHVPTTGLEVARAQAALGLLLEARETVSRVMRLPVKAHEPPPFVAARKAAEQLSSELGERIPAIQVKVVHAPAAESVRIEIDGEAIPAAAADVPRKVNPGRHVVVVRVGDTEKREEVEVREGETKAVTIDASEPPPEPPAEELPGDSAGAPSPGKALVIGGFALAAVGIGVGSVTGIMSLSRTSSLKEACTGTVCPPERRDDLDSAKTLGNVSTVAFLAGAVGAGLGIAGLVLSGSSKSGTRGSGAPHVQATVGPTWMGLRGAF